MMMCITQGRKVLLVSIGVRQRTLCVSKDLHCQALSPSKVCNKLQLEEVRGNSLAKQGMDLIFIISLPLLVSTLRYTPLFIPFDSFTHLLFGSISLSVNRFWIVKFGNFVVLCLNNTLCFIVLLDTHVPYFSYHQCILNELVENDF